MSLTLLARPPMAWSLATRGQRLQPGGLRWRRGCVGVLLGLAPVLASCASPTAGPSGSANKPLATSASCSGVSVYPSPGTKTASPTTQISFRRITPGKISHGGVTVSGSKSGTHSGKWVADSDQLGASFYPTRKFASGELVSVRTHVSICGAGGTAFKFRVGVLAGPVATPPTTAATPSPTLDQPSLTYASLPGVKVPELKVAVPSSLGGGYIFESPEGGTKLGGPMIVNGHGQLVWFLPLPPEVVAADFKVETYQGSPILTYWMGKIVKGHGIGQDIVMNSSYQVVKTISPGNGYSADLHEF
jgi:hypothetical protein